ncbi:MAG: hypothetical protein EOM20_06610 [Spartobacteria bacterium]|nr:hypothetical protein [Spartobacteria bacterium]
MSELVFYCGECGAKLSAGYDEVGDEFECPSCGEIQLVPDVEEEEEEVKPAKKKGVSKKTMIKTKATKAESEDDEDEHAPSRVIRIPKKKIVIAPSASKEVDDEDRYEDVEEEIDDEVAGTGLRVAAMALGTTGVLVAIASLAWVIISGTKSEMEVKDWGILILTFSSTFILGLMGLVLSQIAFRIERTMAYARYIATED